MDDPFATDPQHNHVVTLDGVAMPLVDPQNFQDFWNEREEQKMREQEKTLQYESKREDRGTKKFHSGALSLHGEGRDEDYERSSQHQSSQRQQDSRTQLAASSRSTQRRRPQSAQRSRTSRVSSRDSSRDSTDSRGGTRQQQRPSSAMSRTAPARSSSGLHGGKRSSSTNKRRRQRPKSASRLSGTTGVGARRINGGRVIPSGSEEDRRRVMTEYANSIKAQRQVRPTSSSEYIKLRAAKRRQQAKEFAESLKNEQKRKKIEVKSKINEINKWLLMNGEDYRYNVVEDVNAGAHGMAIMCSGKSGTSRRLMIGGFEREHDKMKIEMDRKKALRALSADGGGGSGSGSGDGGNGSGGNPNASSPQRASARGRSRRVVQNELKSILSDTEELTETLVSQLNELRNCGWNVGYL